MIKIGMMIGDRYEILEKIGTGGMSDVYKATCHKLKRYVAIKILKVEFCSNANFVSKFRIEAQAAAGLMHPNIVNVYDVGEEFGIYYIVMELVEGITLKKYITKKARLSVKESISIAIQISMGIEAAHNNNIIHRDIKPQNIIISKEGKVKVTDFGIAKAATSNTVTSNVMGSVHYTSPEQARGGYSDEKSDIYSLGITIFEMLTGRVPFNGDTTVAIAIKHIQDEMPSPREFVPEIPISVEQIVYKCTQKSQDRRYHSVPELVADLKQSLMNPDDDFVKVVDFESFEETRMMQQPEMGSVKREAIRTQQPRNQQSRTPQQRSQQPRTNSNQTNKKPVQKPAQKYTADRKKQTVNSGYKNQNRYDDDEDFNPVMEKVLTILTVVAGILIGAILLFVVGKSLGLFGGLEEEEQIEQSGKVEMIDILGVDIEEAKTDLEELGISYDITYDEKNDQKKNIVLETSIDAGEIIEKSMTVIVTVNSGTESINVPSVLMLSEGEATVTLQNEKLKVVKEEDFDDTIKKGMVISQNPQSGSMAPEGSEITIIISKGAEENEVEVPNILGKTVEVARESLEKIGLKVGSVIEVENAEYAGGTVCYQSYSVGSLVEEDSEVDIRISLGGTYQYYEVLPAPEDYESGDITIRVDDENGKQIHNQSASSFPVEIKVPGITDSKAGVLTIVYNVTEGNAQVPKTQTKAVVFTKE